jgi:hypothetical protein
MKKLIYTAMITVVITLSFSCKKSCFPANTPSCIRDAIKAEKDNPQSTVTQVDEYLFQGRLVYGFDNGMIADGGMDIKDGSCNTLCHVGGFGGPGADMCNGEHFFQVAELKRNIWKK